jgi:hypothetical protein
MEVSKTCKESAAPPICPNAVDAYQTRSAAAMAANIEDASAWRWFAALLEERRIRWRVAFNNWLVYVDRTQVATKPTFYEAIRAAQIEADKRGLGRL